MIAYYNGKFVEKAQIAVSPDDRGFLFADGVYEVMRTYGGNLFQCEAHLRRLRDGLVALEIDFGDLTGIEDASNRLLKENGLNEATVYIQITRGSAPRRHPFPPPGTLPTVYIDSQPLPTQSGGAGHKAILVPDQRWARCDIKTVALLPNTLACQRAFKQGAYEALLVRDGAILEGSRTNVFFVQDGTLLTAPPNNYILPGITREIVLQLAERLGLKAGLRVCFEQELSSCDEVFVTSTTSEVAPILSVDGRAVGKGVPGPVTCQLQEAFRKLTLRSIHPAVDKSDKCQYL